jgi:hypothetical protein
MAIDTATMTVSITESVTINGTERGNSNSFTLPNIHEVMERTITVPTSEITLIIFGSTAVGTFAPGDVRYVRITNKDASNFVMLNIEGAASTDFTIRLDPGASYQIVSTLGAGTGVVDYADISGYTLEDLTYIKADADTAACDCEIMVACV